MTGYDDAVLHATGKVSAETIRLLTMVLRYLVTSRDRELERQIKSLQLNKALSAAEKERLRDLLDSSRGKVKIQQLLNSGESLMVAKTQISDVELENFNRYANSFGLSYAAVCEKKVQKKILKDEIKELQKQDKKFNSRLISEKKAQLKELKENRESVVLVFREKDIELLKYITDRMNMDVKLNDFGKMKEEISLNSNITEKEKAILNEEIHNQEQKAVSNYFTEFNKASNENVILRYNHEAPVNSITLEAALVKVTDRVGEEACYICQRTNPNNYIEAKSFTDYKTDGKPFVNTEYNLFVNNEQQKCDEFSHGKFTHYSDGKAGNASIKGEEHWENLKAEIKSKGQFTDDLLVFKDKNSFEKYKTAFSEINLRVNREDSLFIEADANSYKDVSGLINNLNGQLADHNLAINSQKQLCNRTNNQAITFSNTMPDDEKIAYWEGSAILRRIENLNEYKKASNQKALLSTTSNEKELKEITEKINYHANKEQELYEEQLSIDTLSFFREENEIENVREDFEEEVQVFNEGRNTIVNWEKIVEDERPTENYSVDEIEQAMANVRE